MNETSYKNPETLTTDWSSSITATQWCAHSSTYQDSIWRQSVTVWFVMRLSIDHNIILNESVYLKKNYDEVQF